MKQGYYEDVQKDWRNGGIIRRRANLDTNLFYIFFYSYFEEVKEVSWTSNSVSYTHLTLPTKA